MDGIFIPKKVNIWNALFLLCGIFFIAMYFFLNFADSEATSGLLVFLIAGIGLCIAALFWFFLNHGAYIRIEENAVHGKYHWFGKLDCKMDEIAFVLPQIHTLTILLKNGRRHTIMGVENSRDLSSAIRRRIFSLEAESPDTLHQKLNALQSSRQKEIHGVVRGVALMFIVLLAAIFLTGGRDFPEFKKADWIIFTAMGFLELCVLIGTFYAAGRCGKGELFVEQLKYRLRGAMIVSQALPSNFIKCIYTDENYTGRVIVCGFPNGESVYYNVQEFAENFQLKTVYTSGIYESIEDMEKEAFGALIDISLSCAEARR